MILAGKVFVNGQVIKESAHLVDEQNDHVKVGQDKIQIQSPELWMLHKPIGYLTSHNDPHHKKTVFDLLPKQLNKLKIVGRLDMMTSGLLLLSNQSKIQTFLEDPKNEIPRIYHVRVFGNLNPKMADILKKGVRIDRMQYAPIRCKVLKSGNQNHWLELVLKEGKNREIRQIMEHFRLNVSKLHRVSYGDFNLKDLPVGKCMRVADALTKKLIEKINANH